jgi:hypothetical protein
MPIVQEAGWTPEPVWTQRLEEKSSAGDRTSITRSSRIVIIHIPKAVRMVGKNTGTTVKAAYPTKKTLVPWVRQP